MNAKQIRNILARACEKAGSQKAWALANGFSQAYICDVLQDRRGIGNSIAKALGYKQIVTYRKVRK